MDGSRSDLSHERRLELVVVALPNEDDPVREISSEKEPHMTLLYLGETNISDADLKHITDFVEHATSQINRFGMDVDRRGELGDQQADVLFFSKAWAKDVARFRSNLLADEVISKAYHSTEQYPEWTPHLTLGYPETPAKKPQKDSSRIHYVQFDRIALWIGDSEGPTFVIKSDDSYLDVAMSETKGETLEEVLAHYGVKGMKWGTRKGGGVRAARRAASPSADATRVSEINTKVKSVRTTKTLTNAELQDAITRMNLEKQYSQLSRGLDKTRTKKTLSFVATILGAAGKQTVQQVASNEMKTRVDQTINQARK